MTYFKKYKLQYVMKNAASNASLWTSEVNMTVCGGSMGAGIGVQRLFLFFYVLYIK